ncbi:hypothetical protein Sjap_026431 [Stephania japonica]|uniref:Calcyclin-binding protein n=1 Tax=Stephania japonica TaxID=461633 RepID=A0AAP0E3H8_9MAGN
MAEECALDLEELRHLQSIAKRPRVLTLITSEIANLEKLSKSASTQQAPAPLATAKVPSGSVTNYTTLSSFSWDQDNEKLKIYVSLEGVEQEKVETVFKPTSVDIKFNDVQGKNYRCVIPKLNKGIVPEKSKVLVKPNKVIITLIKASKGTWLDLHFKEDKADVLDFETYPLLSPADFFLGFLGGGQLRILEGLVESTISLVSAAMLKPNMDKEKDPMAGIMDLMKNMYEEGDEEMKQTIAKAWTDARSGKTADPLKGYR